MGLPRETFVVLARNFGHHLFRSCRVDSTLGIDGCLQNRVKRAYMVAFSADYCIGGPLLLSGTAAAAAGAEDAVGAELAPMQLVAEAGAPVAAGVGLCSSIFILMITEHNAHNSLTKSAGVSGCWGFSCWGSSPGASRSEHVNTRPRNVKIPSEQVR